MRSKLFFALPLGAVLGVVLFLVLTTFPRVFDPVTSRLSLDRSGPTPQNVVVGFRQPAFNGQVALLVKSLEEDLPYQQLRREVGGQERLLTRVLVDIENMTEEALFVGPESFHLIDARDNTWPNVNELGVFREQLSQEQLQPGAHLTGWVVFETLEESLPERMIFEDGRGPTVEVQLTVAERPAP